MAEKESRPDLKLGENINNISLGDLFSLKVTERQLLFSYKGMPENVHFTIVFDDKLSDLNFHVTKNTRNHSDKPQLRIFAVSKKNIDASEIFIKLLNRILKPLNLPELTKKYDGNLSYVSFNSLENSGVYSVLEKKLIDSFTNIKRKKRRLKVMGDIEKQLESFVTSNDLYAPIEDNIEELPKTFEQPVDAGMIVSKDETYIVMRINKTWYTIDTSNLNLHNFLSAFVPNELANRIVWKTKRAMVHVKNANTYSDIQHLNNPIQLIRNPVKQKNQKDGG